MEQPSQPIAATSPASFRQVVPRSFSQRPPLPDRNVTPESVEEAYVSFILFCNPGILATTDTAGLREAFMTPPKSGGKTFSTFTLFELIKQLETKELKTWADLALKLGVEPPDQDKGESSQKIQQYAVRLKRWMHSMHVDAFFEYLLDRPHPYWTQIPGDTNPVSENGRDGVAAEDDMALRALLPHIKPRRGRRKAEEDETDKSSSQRPSPMPDDLSSARPDALDPWSTQPDTRGSAFQFPFTDPLRLSAPMGQPPSQTWTGTDLVQTSISAYPHSAITPASRNAFWSDDPNEPKSAVYPPKPKSLSKRHGAKVVSSAWRSGGAGSTGKTRGRPKLNRGNNDGPFSAFPTTDTARYKMPQSVSDRNGNGYDPPPSTPNTAMTPNTAISIPSQVEPALVTQSAPRPDSLNQAMPRVLSPVIDTTAQTTHNLTQSSPQEESTSARPAKKSRLSLQVPERVGGEVRLATPPPPVVMVNGEATHLHDNGSSSSDRNGAQDNFHEPLRPFTSSGLFPPEGHGPSVVTAADVARGISAKSAPGSGGGPDDVSSFHSEDPSDRTNMDALYAYFTHEILNGNWFDAQGNPIASCSLEEAAAICDTVVENMRRDAISKEAFLINMAALAGGSILLSTSPARLVVAREEEFEDRTRYKFTWELRLGDLRGQYSMHETVLHNRWKKQPEEDGRSTTAVADDAGGSGGADGDGAENGASEDWARKYAELLRVVRTREREYLEMRAGVLEALRISRMREPR